MGEGFKNVSLHLMGSLVLCMNMKNICLSHFSCATMMKMVVRNPEHGT